MKKSLTALFGVAAGVAAGAVAYSLIRKAYNNKSAANENVPAMAGSAPAATPVLSGKRPASGTYDI